MTEPIAFPVDPNFDLVLERVLDISPDLVWEAWTTPEHVKQWFAPKPWTIGECRIDLRPGGEFYSILQGPDGEQFANVNCYLEVTPKSRLVWTAALLPGYRPAPDDPLTFTAVLDIIPEGAGTRYRAMAIHMNPEGRAQHEARGFHEGWGTVVSQLVEYMKSR